MMYLTLSQIVTIHRLVSSYSAAKTKSKQSNEGYETNQWQSIDWKRANRIVKSLQRRIVAAVQSNKWGKVKSLQWILTHSFSAKVLAIKRVTENTGSRTSGVDGTTWKSPKERFQAISSLTRKGYKAKALRRIKIPKGNGKYRMLGIPTMRDRAMQALHLLGLQPIAETTADLHSYGFRPYRSCHDAIGQCFITLARKASPQFILEGDIKSCFDKISHKFILDKIPMDKQVLKQWLKSGAIKGGKRYPTEEGTPQGSIISPTIANMVLDGMNEAIDKAVGIKSYYQKNGYKLRRNNPYKIHFVRYADDWVVTSTDKSVLEQRVIPAIEIFLKERGLELSLEKTSITHIEDGFDFLGQTIRKYNRGKFLIKPSKKSIKKLMEKIRKIVKKMRTVPSYVLIAQINRVTKGWGMYHRHCSASETFHKIDHLIWKIIWKWCFRRHPNKGRKWVAKKYFTTHKNDRWTFFGKDTSKEKPSYYYLSNIGNIPIRRYVKIKIAANPYTKEDEPIFEKHLQRRMLNTWQYRKRLRIIFCRQEGKCPMCKEQINQQTGWNIHHKVERYKGGKDTLDNLVMLHPNCHQQVHYWNIRFEGDVPIRASEQA